MKPYSPIEYWSRLHERDDISAVGQAALPAGLNTWLYRALARNLRAFLRRHRVMTPLPGRVFDIGSGLGYWVEFWHDLGIPRVDGCDLVPQAVDRLNARYGDQGTFAAADISRPGDLPERRYPVVSCMNVLLHVTDDALFEQALRNVAGLVEPGGVLILAEPIVRDASYLPPYTPERHSRARPVRAYAAPLEAAGLELVDLRGATVLANNPIEAGSGAAHGRYVRWWRFVSRRTKRDPRAARWIGPLVDVADRLAMRTGAAPSTKFALFRRPPRPDVPAAAAGDVTGPSDPA